MREATCCRAAAVLLVLTLLCAGAPGQRARFENPSEGYRIYVHKAIKAVPTEPNERQMLAKWGGELEFKDKAYRGTYNCWVGLVRIKKGKGPTTGGEEEEEPEEVDPRSIREQSIEQLNSGTTVEQFLRKRGIKSDLRDVEGERAVKSRDGQEYVVREYRGEVFDDLRWEHKSIGIIRSYMLEDSNEYFGLVAIGPFVDPWRDIVEDMARTLERIELGASDQTSSEETFTNAGFRDRVRSKLVKGWEAYDTEHFIFVTNTRNKGLIKDILADLELMRLAYIARFPPAPGVDLDQVISAVRFCETMADYEAYGGPPGTGGYWNFVDEELVLVDVQTLDKDILKNNPNLKNIGVLDILYHEAMHQYFFYANGHLAPASWFNEGYGEYFGGAKPNRHKGEIRKIDRNRFRMAWIKRSQGHGRWPDLRAFLKMSQGEFYGPSSLQNYAFAWSFCYFLEEQREDPKGNKAWAAIPDNYLKNLREATNRKREELGIDDKNKEWLVAWTNELQDAAYEATFAGIDLAELEKAWIEAIRRWR